MDKLRLDKQEIIKNLINRTDIELTRQRVAIYLNVTGIYLRTSITKNLFKVDLDSNSCNFYDAKRHLNKLFYPAIFNDDDIEIILSYLEYISPDRAKRVREDLIREPNLTRSNGFIYGINNNNKKLKEYYELVEV